MTVVVDASALLAYLHDEPGGSAVAEVLDGAWMSCVNWSEVLQKALHRDVDIEGMEQEFIDIGLNFVPFTTHQAEIASLLWQQTRKHGLSLVDRACLALSIDKNLPVLTADRAWRELNLDVKISVLR